LRVGATGKFYFGVFGVDARFGVGTGLAGFGAKVSISAVPVKTSTQIGWLLLFEGFCVENTMRSVRRATITSDDQAVTPAIQDSLRKARGENPNLARKARLKLLMFPKPCA
jgi:hypothetical protein